MTTAVRCLKMCAGPGVAEVHVYVAAALCVERQRRRVYVASSFLGVKARSFSLGKPDATSSIRGRASMARAPTHVWGL